MHELSLQKRARIERVLVTRRSIASRRQQVTTKQKLDGILLLMVFGFAALILGTVFLIYAEWSPGNQDSIAREYRGLRHNDATVAQEEWK